jgi:hypothetical protein
MLSKQFLEGLRQRVPELHAQLHGEASADGIARHALVQRLLDLHSEHRTGRRSFAQLVEPLSALAEEGRGR